MHGAGAEVRLPESQGCERWRGRLLGGGDGGTWHMELPTKENHVAQERTHSPEVGTRRGMWSLS